MIPNVFISSTVKDLHYLRDAIRETVIELAYDPIMSEYSDIGYSASQTAEVACYDATKECNLAILIVGKRYGELSNNDFSITHNEFKTLKEQKIPVMALIDKKIVSYMEVYKNNKEKDVSFPDMDSPINTFMLIEEIKKTPYNSIIEYSNTIEARTALKKQIALLFGKLLSSQFDITSMQVKDILSEVKTLRHELLKDKVDDAIQYMKATRFFLKMDYDAGRYKNFLEYLFEDIDKAVPIVLKCRDFDEVIKKDSASVIIEKKIPHMSEKDMACYLGAMWFMVEADYVKSEEDVEVIGNTKWAPGYFMVDKDKKVLMNAPTKEMFNDIHKTFLKEIQF